MFFSILKRNTTVSTKLVSSKNSPKVLSPAYYSTLISTALFVSPFNYVPPEVGDTNRGWCKEQVRWGNNDTPYMLVGHQYSCRRKHRSHTKVCVRGVSESLKFNSVHFTLAGDLLLEQSLLFYGCLLLLVDPRRRCRLCIVTRTFLSLSTSSSWVSGYN